MEPQLPDLPAEITGVELTEVFGPFGEQADEEVDPAKPRSESLASQDRTSGSISTSYKLAMHPGERANAQLKTWYILRKLRCCPWRAGQLAKAIHVLQARAASGG